MKPLDQSYRQPERVVYPLPNRPVKPPEFYLFLLGSDLLALGLSLVLAVYFRDLLGRVWPSLPPFSFQQDLYGLLKRAWVFTPVFLTLAVRRVYDRRLPFWEETREIISALVLGFALVYALVSLKKMGQEVSRLAIGFTGMITLVCLPSFRYILKNALFSLKRYCSNTLILGAGKTGQALARALKEEKYLGYQVVGFLDDDAQLHGQILEGFKVFGSVRQAGKFVRLMNIETVFIVGSSFSSERLAEIFAYLQRLVREIFIVPQFYGIGMLNAELSCLFSQKLFLIKIRNNLRSPVNQFIKRFFDLSVAFLLLPLLIPVLLFLGLLIKLDSPGPVFFVQDRVGKGGRGFRIYKLRTMYQNADEILQDYLRKRPEIQQEWLRFRKLRSYDPRITRVGRFLRRFSLDELPQIINVLKGEMSLVGPRPVTFEELSFYRESLSFYFAVRPGITGLWQISGRNLLPFEERIRLDMWYVLNWSLWLDIIILVRTIEAVLSRKGSF